MKLFVFLTFFFLTLCNQNYTRSGINPLSSEKLALYLESNLTVIAMWNNKVCNHCDLDLFTMWKMPYFYVNYNDVIIAATNVGVDTEFDERYNIRTEIEDPQYRLFVHNVPTPFVNTENLPILEWIKQVTGFIPQKESVLVLSDHNYGSLKTKYSDRNILLLFCKPSSASCMNLISGYLTAANIFRGVRNSLFVYVDCSLSPSLCSIHQVATFPSFRFIAPGAEFAVDDNLKSVHGENIIAYMNNKCGTRFLSDGNYDEFYGRNATLDTIAHRFMDNENVEFRKSLLKQVFELTKTLPEASRYFNMMKRILKEGNQAILTELSSVKQQLKSASPGSKENKALSARMNVVHQFEKITTWKTLVLVHPWNLDFLIGKNHLLLLITGENCETCEDATTVFTNLAKRGVNGIIIGSLNGKRYTDYCYRFHLTSYPTVFFFYKGQDSNRPIIVEEKISLFSLRDFVEEKLDEFYGSDL